MKRTASNRRRRAKQARLRAPSRFTRVWIIEIAVEVALSISMLVSIFYGFGFATPGGLIVGIANGAFQIGWGYELGGGRPLSRHTECFVHDLSENRLVWLPTVQKSRVSSEVDVAVPLWMFIAVVGVLRLYYWQRHRFQIARTSGSASSSPDCHRTG